MTEIKPIFMPMHWKRKRVPKNQRKNGPIVLAYARNVNGLKQNKSEAKEREKKTISNEKIWKKKKEIALRQNRRKEAKKNGKATGQHKSVQFSWVELTWDSAKRLNRKKRLDTKQNTEYTIRASASASDYSWECLYSLPQYVCVSVARVRTIFRYAKWFKSQTD